jgi:hypothetical protein
MSKRQTPGYFILASNLIFIVFALSVIHMFLPNIHVMAGMLPVVIVTKAIILALAIFLRLGYSWSKYLLAVLALFTLLGIGDVLDVFVFPTISAIVSIVQIVLVIWATGVVFNKNSR